jgi:hypothetical protein
MYDYDSELKQIHAKWLEPPDITKCGQCFFNGLDCSETDNFYYEGCSYFSEDEPIKDKYPDWIELDEND